MELFGFAISFILVKNIVLTQFLGICPFLGVSKDSKNALGMGLAVIFVIFMSGIVTYGIYHLVLIPLEIPYMRLLTFILVIASLVQFVEMVLKRFIPSLYSALGIYLPLITTNCAVLGVALANIDQGFNFTQTLVYSLSVPIGYLIAIYLFSTIRERLELSDIPTPFKGNSIALIMAALMALAFTGFAGIA
ncbi:TPA: RnfABCDGE type electron transport complex subunit A [bacterium]|jgi:electron transport complex protein RnfA|nr:RnfABCDGE type electron transport complex subunit A [bacterium]